MFCDGIAGDGAVHCTPIRGPKTLPSFAQAEPPPTTPLARDDCSRPEALPSTATHANADNAELAPTATRDWSTSDAQSAGRIDAPLGKRNPAFRGDVETIVGKALEKDREARYARAGALAADLRRYLADEPITARPPSTFYQLRKFSRRNKGLVAGIAATAVALIAGLVVSSTLLVRALRAEQLEKQQRTAAQAAQRIAEAQRDIALDLLGLMDQVVNEGASVSQVLKPYLESQEPGRQAAEREIPAGAIEEILGHGYLIMGDPEAALRHLASARSAARENTPPDRRGVAIDMAAAEAQLRLGRPAEAEALFRSLLERVAAEHGERSPETADARNFLAGALKNQNRLDEAEQMYREVLEIRGRTSAEESKAALVAQYNLLLVDLRRFATRDPAAPGPDELAEAFAGLYFRTRRALGVGDEQSFVVASELLQLHMLRGKFDEGEALCEEWLPRAEEQLGRHHWRTLECLARCGRVAEGQGRLTETAARYRWAAEGYVRVRRDHADTSVILSWTAAAYRELEDPSSEAAMLELLRDWCVRNERHGAIAAGRGPAG